jgi:hypothetical protein
MVDVAGGIALDFTSKANVAALRQRVHQLAASPSSGSSAINNEDSMGGGDMGAGGGGVGGMSGQLPQEGPRVPALATVEDLPDGARLILTPQDGNQLPSLRAQTQAQLPQLDQGDCSGLAISNAQARTPEPKASHVPSPSDPQAPIPPDPDKDQDQDSPPSSDSAPQP